MNEVKEMDEELYGLWALVESNDVIAASWEFKDDATCIQFQGGTYYDWLWEIESGKLKLYLENETPIFHMYSIEGNYLYFYLEEKGEWGLPFIKFE
jgi:hypothetical protein